jgi:hypothetical protein
VQILGKEMSTLVGRLDRSPVDGFSLASGQTFDIVGTGDGLTNGLTSLSLDGRACAAEGGGAFKCFGASSFDPSESRGIL